MIKRFCVGSVSALFAMSVCAASTDAYTQRDVMQCGGVEVALVSSCQSVTVQEGQDQVIPVCSDQTININGKVLRRDIGKVSQLTTDGTTVSMLENVVVAMDCIKGAKGSLVAIGGYGGCGACPEWHGYYSTAGKLEMYSYSNAYRSFGSKGSSEALIKAYGVTAKDLRGESLEIKRITYGQP
ncbi:hypothetical protein [Pseudomonas nunensis]|uniref:Uncharacterized protein n=1 Tax=Pseudomonas nunensis TaxID=2961896 RepID=A0ABY5EE82_9PSED|nr:hypothetical protein [Pseudomonas nunensis]KOY02064.1 hypothetical protein AM274_12860 [Pseudomonas nunensis]KPN88334.1 hypothetical protein AL066_29340 [Pseudomonas nunensis]MCL5226019.1 hypothetical protein [Pseudomonas nunensis]UTO13999.1 hypothetical protein NK667_28180 [Pseudomonas nunensis]